MATDTAVEVPALRRGDRGVPVLGSFFDYLRDPVALMRRQYEHYGPVAPLHQLGGTWVVLLGPDACGTALRNADKAFANAPAWTHLVGPFFRRGLMLLDFEEHHLHRRIMQEAFTRTRLAGYAERQHPAIERGLDTWEPGPAVRTHPAFKQLTLDVATDLFMGGAPDHGPEEMDRVNRAFVDCVQAAGAIVRRDLPLTRWRRGHRGRAVLEEFLRHYLPSRRAERTDDLFSQLCHVETDDGERFTDDDVVDHMVFLMMAAHDTSTSTLTTVVRHLGQQPQWQERCRAESAALPARPTLAELDSLAALPLVVKEALRLTAPVPVVVRRTVKDTVVAGVRIPRDTFCTVALQHTHLMPELWPDPLRFDPERFGEPRREDKVHRDAWLPFGGGVHKCLGMVFAGMEVSAVMHHLLRRFEWRVDPGYRPPMDNLSLPFPKDGQPVDLRRC